MKKEIEENKYICNSCHEHYPANEMDFDAENESDLCKNCNYISYNDSPYANKEDNKSEKVNSVKASRFLNWYFSDSDDIKEFGNSMLKQLMTFGIANIDVKQLFDGCALIPEYICEDWDEDWGNEQEYSPEQIEFINDLK
jgi:hypothetical protein